MFISFAGILALGITSYNHSGISRESRREEEGILFPFFYFSYYLREKHQDQVEQNNRVLDSVVDDLGNIIIRQFYKNIYFILVILY